MRHSRLLLVLILLLPGFLSTQSANIYGDCIRVSEEGVAVSLRSLQAAVQSGRPGRPPAPEISQLGGMTELCGYIVDSIAQDIILIGCEDATAPKLHLDDFVVALRNAFGVYTRVEGNTRYYSHPGCSIDPDPSVMQDLDRISEKINSSQSAEEIEALLRQWEDLCCEPQSVRIMGVPFDTRFAKVLVEADYHMKTVVNGSDTSLQVQGLRSLSDMTLDSIKAATVEKRPISIPISTMNRFWFYPGQISSWADPLSVVVTRCKVTLLTEQEHLSREGSIQGAGRPNPIAEIFCSDFSERFDEVARQRSIYAELKALFRFVTIARLLHAREDLLTAGLNLDYLINEYAVETTPVARELDGRSNVKSFSHREDYEDGWSEVTWWLPSCGGVTIEIVTDRIETAEDADTTGNRLQRLRQRVIRARPEGTYPVWRYRTEH